MLSLVRALGGDRRSGTTTTLSNPAQWFVDWLSGGAGSKTRAGLSINERNALTMSTVWACVNTIADDCSKVPVHVLRRIGPDTSEPVPDHPVHRLLNVTPNEEMTAKVFRETLKAHALTWGNGYAEIERAKNGKPLALWPMTPDAVQVERVYLRETRRSIIRYRYTNPDGAQQILAAEDVLHVRGLGFDGLVGYSVIRQARESLGLTLAAEAFGAAFFGNGARPSIVLSHPGKLGKQALTNLRESVDKMHAGVENAGRPLVLEEGMTAVQLQIPPDDAQFLQTRQFQVPEVCRWYRMPPHKIADLNKATYSNIEHSSLEYVDDCLGGWFVRAEQEYGWKLFGPSERGLCVEHNADELKRGDRKSRYDAYAVGRMNGWLSVNDVRRMEGENPVPGGDDYHLAVNMAPLGAAGNPSPDAAAAGRSVKRIEGLVMRFAPLLRRDIAGCLKIESDRLRRVAKRDELKAWAAEFYPEHFDHVRAAMFATFEVMAEAIARLGTDLRVPPVAELVRSAADAHVRRSGEDLKAAGPADVEKVIEGWERTRADEQAELELRRVLVTIAATTTEARANEHRAA